MRRRQRHRVVARPADHRLDIHYRQAVRKVAQDQAVVAGSKIDRTALMRGTEHDRVVFGWGVL